MGLYSKIANYIKAQKDSAKFGTVKDLAAFFNVKSHTTIYDFFKGRSVPNAEAFLDWAEKLGVKLLLPEEFERLGCEFYPVPKVKARPMGGFGGLETDDEITGFYAFKLNWLQVKCPPASCVLMESAGDSMSPTISERDIVLIDQSEQGKSHIIPGKIYVLRVDDSIMVKRIDRMPGQLILRSDNSYYPPINIKLEDNNSLEIIGRVVWVGKEL